MLASAKKQGKSKVGTRVWKGKNRTVPIHRKHDCLYRKSLKSYKKNPPGTISLGLSWDPNQYIQKINHISID